MRQLFLILILFCAGFAFRAPFYVLGPNIEYNAFTSGTPLNIRGAFVPQASTSFNFSWIEPLGADGYGVWKPNKTNYIRFLAGIELSPFYGTIRAGVGFAPLPPPFAVLELRFIYNNENLLWSDVEMPMKKNKEKPIEKAWNAKYIFNNFYKKSDYSQIQSYDTQLGGKYISPKIDMYFLFTLSLIDIASDFEEKSFDYMRGIPLYSRDYIVSEELSINYKFSKKLSLSLDFYGIQSGRRFKFYSPFEAYDKEPLSYYIISTGPAWSFNDNKSHISVSPGFFMRGNEDGFFEDSIKEQILFSVKFMHFWDFDFGKN